MRPEPTRCVALGIYDADGTLVRTIAIDEDGNLAEPLEAVDHPQMVYAMIESDARQIVAVPWMTKAAPAHIENRWAAFTDDELEGLAGYDHDLNGGGSMGDAYDQLYTEIQAELERRKP